MLKPSAVIHFDQNHHKNITINIDMSKKIVKKENIEISLTAKEYELLLFLIKNKNSMVSNGMIEQQLWNNEEFMPAKEEPGIVDQLKASLLEALPFLPQEDPKELTEEQMLGAVMFAHESC